MPDVGGTRLSSTGGAAGATGATGATGPTGPTGATGGTVSIVGQTYTTQAGTAPPGAYGDLSVVGPQVSATMTGTKAILWFSLDVQRTVPGNTYFVAVEVSGATSVPASDDNSTRSSSAGNNFNESLSRTLTLTGLNPGPNTFTLKYKVDGGIWDQANGSITLYAP